MTASNSTPVLPTLVAALLLALGGCATCQQHPTACAIGGAIVVGSIAASYGRHDDQNRMGASSHNSNQGLGPQVRP